MIRILKACIFTANNLIQFVSNDLLENSKPIKFIELPKNTRGIVRYFFKQNYFFRAAL